MGSQCNDQVSGSPEQTPNFSFKKPGDFQRVSTWRDITPVIEDSVEGYSKQREHWKACAEQARNLIEEQLMEARDDKNEDIFAKVTSRAKETGSLRNKLTLRNFHRPDEGLEPYRTMKEIDDDLVDLAGVRVVLYTPNDVQRKKVKEIILSIWGLHVKSEPHDDSRPKEPRKQDRNAYIPKHLGYQAEHYRTAMLKNQGIINTYDWSPGGHVEIQVVSALGHAWAEAGHDVLYKTHANGRPTTAEERILDALNGLIVSGDLLLEQFRESVAKRTVASWKHVSDLEAFLQESDILERVDGDNDSITRWRHFSKLGSDILFRFLEKIRQNNGSAVRNALLDLGHPEDPELKLKEQLHRSSPTVDIREDLLTCFCVLASLVPERQRSENVNAAKQCRVMLDALILLQTFAGGSEQTRLYLTNPKITRTVFEGKGLNTVLVEPHRDRCLDGEPVEFFAERLLSAWTWFEKQAADQRSLCGLFFKLAEMDVPAKELDNVGRLRELELIGALSIVQPLSQKYHTSKQPSHQAEIHQRRVERATIPMRPMRPAPMPSCLSNTTTTNGPCFPSPDQLKLSSGRMFFGRGRNDLAPS